MLDAVIVSDAVAEEEEMLSALEKKAHISELLTIIKEKAISRNIKVSMMLDAVIVSDAVAEEEEMLSALEKKAHISELLTIIKEKAISRNIKVSCMGGG